MSGSFQGQTPFSLQDGPSFAWRTKSKIPKFQIGRQSARAFRRHARREGQGVANVLPRTNEGRYISQQLLRSGLSTAANYAEARAAESRADFVDAENRRFN